MPGWSSNARTCSGSGKIMERGIDPRAFLHFRLRAGVSLPGLFRAPGLLLPFKHPASCVSKRQMSRLSVVDAGRYTFSAGVRLASTERRSSDALGLWPFSTLGAVRTIRHSPHLRHVRGELSRDRSSSMQPVPVLRVATTGGGKETVVFLEERPGLLHLKDPRNFPSRPLVLRVTNAASG